MTMGFMNLRRAAILLTGIAIVGVAFAQDPWSREGTISTDMNSYAEFAFTRIIFKSGFQALPGPGNTAWRDWPTVRSTCGSSESSTPS